MFFKMKYVITICFIICCVLIIILIDLDYYPSTSEVFNEHSSITTKDLIDDLNDFSKHFEHRFEDLKKFIRDNQHQVDQLDITYYLFTYLNPNSPYILKPTQDSWIRSNLDPKYPTIFILHGYDGNTDMENGTYTRIKDQLLNRYRYRNIFIVDYHKYVTGLFSKTAKISFLVSQNLVNFIRFLMKNATMPADQFHLIGASLGGQVAANAASFIPGFGRVTGLDPAGPIFDLFPPNYRISSDDAQFVDVIHTGSASPFPKGVGISYSVGDIDFYPNGGQHQPGCEPSRRSSSSKKRKSVMVSARCSHERAALLFLESIKPSSCQFVGVKCNSYGEFVKGHCNPVTSDTVLMGYEAQEREAVPSFRTKINHHKGNFYLITNSSQPFCTNKTETMYASHCSDLMGNPWTTFLVSALVILVFLFK